MSDHASHPDATQRDAADRPQPVPVSEVWRIVLPGLGYVFLALAGVYGLFTASEAGDGPTYAAGLGLFILAALLIAVRLKLQFDGSEVGFLLPMVIERLDSLLVAIAVLTVLGLGGFILAAAVGGALYGIGLALFVVSALIIFLEIKRYFDRRDAGL